MDRGIRVIFYLAPLVGLGALIAGLYLVFGSFDGELTEFAALQVYCGVEIAEPVDEAVGMFQRRTGIRVELHVDHVPRLLDQIHEGGAGHFLLTADETHLRQAEQEGLVAHAAVVAHLSPVILVGGGSAPDLVSAADLAAPGMRLGLAEQEASLLGRTTAELFAAAGVPAGQLQERTELSSNLPEQLGRAVELGRVDAAVLWRTVAELYPRNTQILEVPAAERPRLPVTICQLTAPRQDDRAREFMQFFSGTLVREVFRDYGYEVDSEQAGPE